MNGAAALSNLIPLFYKTLLRPILFCMDPEQAHGITSTGLKQIGRFPGLLKPINRCLKTDYPALAVTLKNVIFPNPVGLAAGFDKDAELIGVLPSFGFGFVEAGTFTPLRQQGQNKPRLFRYPKHQALINRMGFNNPGIKTAAQRLRDARKKEPLVPIGVNIGKGRETPLEEAADDYLICLEQIHPYADYIVLNVSSPNTPHLRDLQSRASLAYLLTRIMDKNRALSEESGGPLKLIFLKISPDVSEDMLEEIGRLAVQFGIGLVATNTTVDHSVLETRSEEGGLSGRPLKEKSNKVIRFLYKCTSGLVPIIGVGGIFTARDAYEKIQLGASLIQIYTGWIYEGPDLARRINEGLLTLMNRDGFKKIQDAVGTSPK